jgi:hypothetical protein
MSSRSRHPFFRNPRSSASNSGKFLPCGLLPFLLRVNFYKSFHISNLSKMSSKRVGEGVPSHLISSFLIKSFVCSICAEPAVNSFRFCSYASTPGEFNTALAQLSQSTQFMTTAKNRAAHISFLRATAATKRAARRRLSLATRHQPLVYPERLSRRATALLCYPPHPRGTQ